MVDYRQFSFSAAQIEPLLKLKIKDGKLTNTKLQEKQQLILSRETMQKQLSTFDESYKRLLNPHIYKVSLTENLKNLKSDFIKKNLK